MITLHACAACGHTVFPARQLCRSCGGATWTDVSCDRGVVTGVTMLLAEVATPQNVRVIARLRQTIPPGTTVALDEAQDGALWGI